MPSLPGITRWFCALTGLALAGCYSPYHNVPYSTYPAGPGIPMYSPQQIQPQFGPPVGSPTPVYPDGGFPSGGINPNGSFPPAGSTFGPGDTGGFGGSQFNNNGGLAPIPDPGGALPPLDNGGGFGPTPPATNTFPRSFDPSLPANPGGGSGLVPRYGDPETLPAPRGGGGGTFENNATPFSSDGASFQQDPPGFSTGQIPPQPNPGGIQLAAHQLSPVETLPEADKFRGSPSPYGFDPVGYRWLKGIVDYDEHQQAWVIIYSPTPHPKDAFKGQITLINSALFSKLKNNDAVMVEGRVDENFRDPGTGKPQFQVQRLHYPPKTQWH